MEAQRLAKEPAKVTVEVAGQAATCVPRGTLLEAILPGEVDGLPVLAALVNNDVAPLDMPLLVNAQIKPLTLADERLSWGGLPRAPELWA